MGDIGVAPAPGLKPLLAHPAGMSQVLPGVNGASVTGWLRGNALRLSAPQPSVGSPRHVELILKTWSRTCPPLATSTAELGA